MDKYEKENFDNYKNYVGQLENEYLTTFKKIEVYINESTKLNTLEKNNCFLQILDTFLSSQVGDKVLKDITGGNLKKYCDDMIYGQTIYSYKVSRICFLLVGALFYVSFMHFFTRICESIYLKDSSIIFQPMKFGIGEIILIVGYICIPKLIAVINRNYFENPARCKKVKRYTYYSVWLFTITIYSLMKEPFNIYGIFIPFSTIVLILVYSAIVCAAVWLVTGTVKTGNLENRKEKMEKKYFEIVNKQYEKHKAKCAKSNKDPLDWNKFMKKKVKDNCIVLVLFFIYAIILFGLVILLGWGMLAKADIDLVGIIILIVVSLLESFIVGVIKEGINRNKELAQMES